MLSLSRNSLIYVIAAGLSAAIPFLTLPLLARLLGPGDFGLMGTYLAFLNLAVVLVGLSAHGFINVVYFRDGPAHVPIQVGGSLRVLLMTAVPMLLLALTFSARIEDLFAIPPSWIWTIVIAASAQFVVSVGLAVFQASEQPYLYGALQIGLSFSWAILSLLFIGIFDWGWEGRAAGQLGGGLLLALVTLISLHKQGMFVWETDWLPVRAAMRFCLPLLPHSLAGAIMGSVDRLTLNSLAGPETAGHYFAAFQIAAVITVVASALNQAWVPWLFRHLATPTQTGLRSVVRQTYLVYAGLLAAATLIAVAAPPLVRWMAGSSYEAASQLLPWLAFAAAFSGMYFFVTNYIFYLGRTEVLSLITVSCSVIQLTLIIFLVPHFGAQGAAIVVFATAVLFWICTWYAAHRLRPMPWNLWTAKVYL